MLKNSLFIYIISIIISIILFSIMNILNIERMKKFYYQEETYKALTNMINYGYILLGGILFSIILNIIIFQSENYNINLLTIFSISLLILVVLYTINILKIDYNSNLVMRFISLQLLTSTIFFLMNLILFIIYYCILSKS